MGLILRNEKCCNLKYCMLYRTVDMTVRYDEDVLTQIIKL